MSKWKDIKGYENLYKISNLGEVKSLPRKTTKGGIIKPNRTTSYQRICLVKNGFIKSYSIHRLVALAFIPNPQSKPYVNHKNGIRSDNRAINLEWVTPSENNLHAFRNNLSQSHKGSKHPLAKLTEKEVLNIRKLANKYSQQYIAKIYGVSFQCISDIVCRKKWKHI